MVLLEKMQFTPFNNLLNSVMGEGWECVCVFSCSLANTFQIHSKSTRGRDCHLAGMAKGRAGVHGRRDAALLGGQLEFPHVPQYSLISRAAAGNTPKGYP